MRLYYTDQAERTVGPITLQNLHELRASGAVTDATPVIEEGASTWRRYADYSEGSSPAASSYAPPPPPSRSASREDEMREQLSAGASKAADAASATAQVLGQSVMNTFRGASSLGERIVLFGSVVTLLAFFLPWVDGFGGSISGMGAAGEVSNVLWLLPLSAIGCFFLSYLNIRAQSADRVLRARWFIVTGAFWLAISLFLTVAGRALFGVASIGLYLTVISTAALTAGGIMQIGDSVKALRGR